MHILLADDHSMFRSGLRRILADEFPDATIEEAASCGKRWRRSPGRAGTC